MPACLAAVSGDCKLLLLLLLLLLLDPRLLKLVLTTKNHCFLHACLLACRHAAAPLAFQAERS
jgi:hypothetical protein